MADKFNLEGFAVDENNVCTSEGGFVGSWQPSVETVTVNGLVNDPSDVLIISGFVAVLELSLEMVELGKTITISCLNANNDCIVTFTGATINGAGNNTATFNAKGETLQVMAIGGTTWAILANVDGVLLTTV
jgi:hypothetical protein